MTDQPTPDIAALTARIAAKKAEPAFQEAAKTLEAPETARALLYRHGLPEDVLDGALCPTVRDGLAGTANAEPAAGPVVAAASRADDAVRDRIAAALDTAFESFDPEATEDAQLSGHLADAVAAVLPPAADRATVLLEAAEWLEARTCPCGCQRGAGPLRRLAAEAQQPEPECTCGGPGTCTTLPSGITYEEHKRTCAVMTDDGAEARQQPDTETPCGPAPDTCDAEAGEPCANHEREQAHAEGEHCFCGPECQDAEPSREETGAALARYIADRPISEIQAAIRILGWPTLCFEVTEVDDGQEPDAGDDHSCAESGCTGEPGPAGSAAADTETPGPDLLRNCECGGTTPHPDCPIHADQRAVCVCGHTRGEHIRVGGPFGKNRLLCDVCDPDSTDNLTCEEFEAL